MGSMNRFAPSIVLFLAAALGAQQATTPAGMLNQEANASFPDLLGAFGAASGQNTYYTALDASNTGPARQLTRLSLRRDGQAATNPAYVARTVTMTIRMAHGNLALVANNRDNNEATLRTSPWIEVFTPKTVTLPDHAQQPAGLPTFDIHLPLDVPFPYNGQQALFYQFKCSPSNLPANNVLYPLDGVFETSFNEGPFLYQGVGCQVAGRSQPMRHESHLRNYGPMGNTNWLLFTQDGPANAPLVIVMGRTNPALPVGGCAPLMAQPNLVFPGGMTDANGHRNHALTFLHEAQFIGATVYTQTLAPDPAQAGLPIAFTNGMRTTYPTNPVHTVATACTTVWTTSGSFPSSFPLIIGEALVVGLTW
jgi:hypothetical protein